MRMRMIVEEADQREMNLGMCQMEAYREGWKWSGGGTCCPQ